MKDLAGYATLRPMHELLDTLASIAAYQDAMHARGRSAKNVRWGRAGAWCIVKQREIIAWWSRTAKRFGRPISSMSRRTLNYQLAGLERDRYIKREQRHTSQRDSRKLALRPSLIKFTTLGKLWIKRHSTGRPFPLEPLAVQTFAQSGFNSGGESSTSLLSAVDKTIHSEGPSAPRKTAAARRRVSSSIAGKVRRPSKAPSRGGPRSTTRRATKRQAPRNATKPARRGRAPGKTRQRR